MTHTTTSRSGVARFLHDRILPLLLVAVSILALSASVHNSIKQDRADRQRDFREAEERDYFDCQAAVYDQLILVLQRSRDVSTQVQEADEEVYRQIRDNPRNYAPAIDEFLRQSAERKRVQAANPIPDPPTSACPAPAGS